ncbi:helix-turn-helix transcriptional regulator [Streptomyces millisiae]|uniref:Helix-turn-helix transcriptional regulator n=1 Tax=Streptomyces millisiae TaxID=3075542 RepID=A0ABU2LZU0_9ACTN|nr:helix-turn-helix transcriptional regulator [Streptomyces sp. DSM 44918]MDT0323086.1 helix-turn-helix transcriptional regulator [Streptomyces sp. DSM 44918]
MAREQHGGDSGGTELGHFLRARRGRVRPEDVGLPAGAGPRRTPGLRREELATLAGISIDYYARLERGKETHPSPSVVDALARVLRLDEAERRHLRGLVAGAERQTREATAPPSRSLPPGVDLLLESMRPHPVYVVSRTFDLLAANPGALRLFVGIEDEPAERRNLARYVFLHPVAREVMADREAVLRSPVAWLRQLAGMEPNAPDLTALVDELLHASTEFAELWERYDVQGSARGQRTFHHPDVGDLTLGFQGMALSGTDGQHLVAFYAEPGSPDHDAMVLLDKAAQQQHGPAPSVPPGH